MALEDLFVGLPDVPALDRAIRPREHRGGEPVDPVAVADSAVAVEEKSVIDYNKGNPDGVLDPGEVPKPPKIPAPSERWLGWLRSTVSTLGESAIERIG